MRSIRARVLVGVLGLLALMLTGLSWRSYLDARHEIEEVFDAQLVHAARLVAALVGPQIHAADPIPWRTAMDTTATSLSRLRSDPSYTDPHDYETKVGFIIIDAPGTVVLSTEGTPVDSALALLARQPSLEEAAALPTPDASVFHEVDDGVYRWRLFLLRATGPGFSVFAVERDDVRGELASHIAWRGLAPDLLGIPLMALLVAWSVHWGLKPLRSLALLMESRDPARLDPVVLHPLPMELNPTVTALNGLLTRMTATLARERRFLSDAAHELRTPLAVLHLHAHNARHAQDPADRAAAVDHLDGAVLRATRLAEQLLTLARLESGAGDGVEVDIDPAAFLRQELAELAPLSLDRRQELILDIGRDVPDIFRAYESGLRSMVQNLVTNAIRHAPIGGRIAVALSRGPGHAMTLQVDDDGPGIAPQARAQVLEPFHREGDSQGAGLGLAIVARVVHLHGGALTLAYSPWGGLRVSVVLPLRERPEGVVSQAG
jgi:two-component system sensor histidine kinase QseC